MLSESALLYLKTCLCGNLFPVTNSLNVERMRLLSDIPGNDCTPKTALGLLVSISSRVLLETGQVRSMQCWLGPMSIRNGDFNAKRLCQNVVKIPGKCLMH